MRNPDPDHDGTPDHDADADNHAAADHDGTPDHDADADNHAAADHDHDGTPNLRRYYQVVIVVVNDTHNGIVQGSDFRSESLHGNPYLFKQALSGS